MGVSHDDSEIPYARMSDNQADPPLPYADGAFDNRATDHHAALLTELKHRVDDIT